MTKGIRAGTVGTIVVEVVEAGITLISRILAITDQTTGPIQIRMGPATVMVTVVAITTGITIGTAQ